MLYNSARLRGLSERHSSCVLRLRMVRSRKAIAREVRRSEPRMQPRRGGARMPRSPKPKSARAISQATAEIEALRLPSEKIAEMASTCMHPSPATVRGVPHAAATTSLQGTFEYEDVEGHLVNGALRYTCGTRRFSRLMIGSGKDRRPLSARSLAYYFSSIQWWAGRGWPLYSCRCPLQDTGKDMLYPNLPRHSLLVMFGGFCWHSCANSEAGTGVEINDVFVGVNDDQYPDNTGTFIFVVTSFGT